MLKSYRSITNPLETTICHNVLSIAQICLCDMFLNPILTTHITLQTDLSLSRISDMFEINNATSAEILSSCVALTNKFQRRRQMPLEATAISIMWWNWIFFFCLDPVCCFRFEEFLWDQMLILRNASAVTAGKTFNIKGIIWQFLGGKYTHLLLSWMRRLIPFMPLH